MGPTLTGLLAGTYTVTAVDTGGCHDGGCDVDLLPSRQVEVTTEGVSCNGDADGTASTVGVCHALRMVGSGWVCRQRVRR